MQQNNQFYPAASTVLNEAANSVKQGGSGKKKRKKLRRSTVYKAPSRTKKRKHSNTETASDFEVEAVPKKLIKYNFKMEDLLREWDYFELNVMQLSVMCDYDRVFATGQTLVQGGPIEFFVRGADELSLDLNNSKLEIK